MLLPILLSSAFVFLLPTTADGACAKDSLPCDDGQCVRREDWCDDGVTCNDKSDEAYCGERNWFGISPNKCNKKIHFRCEDGRCWPLSARCDGTEDCGDGSDEEDCDSEGKESEEKVKEPDETIEKPEVRKDTDEEDKSKEIPEEEKKESKENSEETGSEQITTTVEIPSTTTTSSDDYDDFDYNGVEVTSETTPPHTVDDIVPSEEVSPEIPISSRPTVTEMDYYAKKMEQSEIKPKHSTQTNVHPTSAYTYRPPPVRPAAHYPTSRRPAVPYTGPTRPYTPRPYRYIGAQYSGQVPSPYRGRYQQTPGSPYQAPGSPYQAPGSPYHYNGNNYIPSHPRSNQWQSYRNQNHDTDYRNGVTRPPRVYGRQLRAPSRFYFKRNYNEIYGRSNTPAVRRGVEWIVSVRNATGGWGKETPRALVALSLVNNSFLAGSYENDLMQKYFQVHLGMNLLRNEAVSLNRLAMFVNALIATCQDPRDFQGWDLTELIRNSILKVHRVPRPPVINPLVYLSLCLADRNLTHYEVNHLSTYLVATRNDEGTRDMMYLALEALACHMQKEKHNVANFYSLQKMAWNATTKILQRMREDGSFGSVYSTALAAQALLSVNETSVDWNPEPTFRFLKRHQRRNGSFGDFLATYYVLPALSGRSLLHLRNTECNPPRVDRELSPQEILKHPGPKFYIRYSLHMGNPLATGHTVQVFVPTGISFFDVMRVAAYENDHFKFSYEEVNGKLNVYSINDIPNDPEVGLAWRLYVRSPADIGNIPNIQQLYTGDIREFQPTPDQHVVFWYHPLGF